MWLPYDIDFGIYRDQLAVVLHDESEAHFVVLNKDKIKMLKDMMEKFEI